MFTRCLIVLESLWFKSYSVVIRRQYLVETFPGAAKKYPKAAEKYPKATEKYPMATEKYPKIVDTFFQMQICIVRLKCIWFCVTMSKLISQNFVRP